MSPRLRVIKLGGSLLEMEQLSEQLRRWLAEQSPARNLLIVGGGKLADWVRQADDRLGLGEEASHWLAIRAMGVAARVVSRMLPEATLTSEFSQIQRDQSEEGLTVFDVESFLRVEEPQLEGERLAKSWDVTSDSIAARLAIVSGADELVVLKSDLPAPGIKLEALSENGYLDRFFSRLTSELPVVRAVDLHDPAFRSMVVFGRPNS